MQTLAALSNRHNQSRVLGTLFLHLALKTDAFGGHGNREAVQDMYTTITLI